MAETLKDGILFEENQLKRYPADRKGTYIVPEGCSVGMHAFCDCEVEELVIPEGVTYLMPTSLAGAKFGKVVFLSDQVDVIDTNEARMARMATFSGDGYSAIKELVYTGSNPQFIKNITWGAEVAILSAPNVEIDSISKALKVPALIGYIKAANEGGLDIPDAVREGYEKAVKSSRKKLFSMGADFPYLPRYVIKMGYLSPKEAQTLASTVENDPELVAMLLEYQQVPTATQSKTNTDAPAAPTKASEAPKEDTPFEYAEVEGGIEIVKLKGKAPKKLVIPDEIDGKTVVSIGKGAFSKKSIESLTLPKGLRTIHSTAFAGCHDLAKVSIPASVRVIEASAFSSCWTLTKVAFPKKGNLVEIGTKAFSGTQIRSLVVPPSVVEIGKSAFGDAALLTFPGGAKVYPFDFPDRRPIVVIDTVTAFTDFTKSKEKLSVAAGYIYMAAYGKIEEIPANVATYIKKHTGKLLSEIALAYGVEMLRRYNKPLIEWLFDGGFVSEKEINGAINEFSRLSYSDEDSFADLLQSFK